MGFFRHHEIRVFHLSTDKSTGKDDLSGATNERLGQHRQLISPPMIRLHGQYLNILCVYTRYLINLKHSDKHFDIHAPFIFYKMHLQHMLKVTDLSNQVIIVKT